MEDEHHRALQTRPTAAPEWAQEVMNTPQRLGFLPTIEFWYGSGQAIAFLGKRRRKWLTLLQVLLVAFPVLFLENLLLESSWVTTLLSNLIIALVFGGVVEGAVRRGLAKKYPELAPGAPRRELSPGQSS